jgi:enamine deaminase RidA (YjgF/YER057c/UK114 family)
MNPSSHIEFIQPNHFARPRGYANGALVRGRMVFVAGQIGWDADQTFSTDDFVEQFANALDNVLAVVAAAGGAPTDIADMTVYVTDLAAYRQRVGELGPVWRARLGRHFPAMALVGVVGLVEPRAKVEIQAVACLPEDRGTALLSAAP